MPSINTAYFAMLPQIYKSISEKQNKKQKLYIKVILSLGQWFFTEFVSGRQKESLILFDWECFYIIFGLIACFFKKNVSKILDIKNKVASLRRQTMTNIFWSIHLRARIPASHAGHRGSNPLSTTQKKLFNNPLDSFLFP